MDVNPIVGKKDSVVFSPNSPYKDGYKFAGWYSNEQLTQLYSFSRMPGKNIILYAKWVTNDKMVISYNLDGSINDSSNPTSFTVGEEIILKEPIKDDYHFVGWYLDSEYKNPVTKITVTMNQDITLYARFEKDFIIEAPNTGFFRDYLFEIIGGLLLIIGGYFYYKGKSTVNL